MSQINVIYDGQCEFCKNALAWVNKKLATNAIDFHTADLTIYNLNKEQCSREVFVVYQESTLGGAAAIAFLLKARGNRLSSVFITALGPISRFGYRWVANNRNSVPVKILSQLLKH
jgi:predicted DCC family thiol-disulfide oxidoreductase YuxK